MYVLDLNKNGNCIGYRVIKEIEYGVIEVPKELYPTDQSYLGRKFDVENAQWLDEWDESLKVHLPEPEPSPQEKIISFLEYQNQSNLDRDELQIDAAIKMEEIKLALENTNKFSGGGGVTN